MNKEPDLDPNSAPLLPEILERWSPRAFDNEHPLSEPEITSLLEAIRWSPSSGNNQPWRVAVIKQSDSDFEQFVGSGLAAGNAIWAKNSQALFVLISVTQDETGKDLDRSLFSTGMAAAQLQLQAQYLGLHSHHMSGVDVDWIAGYLKLDASMVISSVLAIGRLGDVESLDDALAEREKAPRTRKPLSEIVLRR